MYCSIIAISILLSHLCSFLILGSKEVMAQSPVKKVLQYHLSSMNPEHAPHDGEDRLCSSACEKDRSWKSIDTATEVKVVVVGGCSSLYSWTDVVYFKLHHDEWFNTAGNVVGQTMEIHLKKMKHQCNLIQSSETFIHFWFITFKLKCSNQECLIWD